MPLDLNTALNSYGFVGQLANAIPDLKGILNTAIAQQWVPEQFTRAVMDSGWWKTNAESARQLVRLQATDPATYAQNLANAASKAQLVGRQMGRDHAGADWNHVGFLALLNNWDDEQLRSQIPRMVGIHNQEQVAGAAAGDAGQLLTHMRKLATDYGVAHSDRWLTDWVTHIQAGMDTLAGFDSLIKARAKAQYVNFGDQIDAGMTIRDIADPYIATYAQTLELPETQVSLSDPAIQKALQYKDTATGVLTNKPMHQFLRELKDDPRWDKTQNAEQEAYRMVNRLGKDMGFLS